MPPARWSLRRPPYRRFSAILYYRLLKHDYRSASLYASSMLMMFEKPPVWLVRLCFIVFRYHKSSKVQINRFFSKVNERPSMKSFMHRFDFIMHLIYQGEIKEAHTAIISSIIEKNYTTSPLVQGVLALIEIHIALQPDESFANSLQNKKSTRKDIPHVTFSHQISLINRAAARLKSLFKRRQRCEVYVAKLIQIMVRDLISHDKSLKTLYRYCNAEPENPNPLKLLLVFLFNFYSNDNKKIVRVTSRLGRLDPICPIVRKAMSDCFSKHWISPSFYCAYLTRAVDYEPENPALWQVICKIVPQLISESGQLGAHATAAQTSLDFLANLQDECEPEREFSTENEGFQTDDSDGEGFQTDDSDSGDSEDIVASQSLQHTRFPASQRELLSQAVSDILEDNKLRSVTGREDDNSGDDGDDDGDDSLDSREAGGENGDVESPGFPASVAEKRRDDRGHNATNQGATSPADSNDAREVWHTDWWGQLHFDPIKLNRYLPGHSRHEAFRTDADVRQCITYKVVFASMVYGAQCPFVVKARQVLKS